MLQQVTIAAERELLTVIDEEADRLNRLVAGVIELARIEAGKLHPERRAHNVAALVGGALRAKHAALDGHPVSAEIPDGMAPVDVDGEFIQEALKQLLDNAAKYSAPDGPITLRAERSGRKVLLSVADRGAGIPGARSAARLREVLSRRRPSLRGARQRARPGHRQGPRGSARRQDLGDQRARARIGLHVFACRSYQEGEQ